MTHTGLEAYLQQTAFEETLARLYGAEGAERARERCTEVVEGFARTFRRPAEALFSAPGRTELGGNHTDHQHGCVLAAAVDLDILAAAAPNGSSVIRVLSQGYPLTEVDLRAGLRPARRRAGRLHDLQCAKGERPELLGCL